MKNDHPWRRALLVAALWALAGCGGGGGGDEPSGAERAGVTAAAARFTDALRRGDAAAVQGTLAPDYNYNGQNAAQASDLFDRLLGISYSSLDYRIESVTARRGRATAWVVTVFQGTLNLEALGLGRPEVNGTARNFLELEPRGAEWRITALRPFRIRFARPPTPAPRLYDYTVNGRTSVEVSPGAPLKLSGKSDIGVQLLTSIGAASRTQALQIELEEPWEVTLPAPGTPGRFLATAFSFTLFGDPAAGGVQFLAGDQVTIPVNVVQQP